MKQEKLTNKTEFNFLGKLFALEYRLTPFAIWHTAQSDLVAAFSTHKNDPVKRAEADREFALFVCRWFTVSLTEMPESPVKLTKETVEFAGRKYEVLTKKCAEQLEERGFAAKISDAIYIELSLGPEQKKTSSSSSTTPETSSDAKSAKKSPTSKS